jgi:adenylyltransferase/sulfurtransferase
MRVPFSMENPEYLQDNVEWGMLFAVMNPEPGDWGLEVTGVLSSDSYQIFVFGKDRPVEVEVSTPSYAGQIADGFFRVAGSMKNAPQSSQVVVYVSQDRENFAGQEVASDYADAKGAFSMTVDSSALPDGEYYVYVRAGNQDSNWKTSYAPGSAVVRHFTTLSAAEQFIASQNGGGSMEIHFKDPNAGLAKGFNLTIQNLTKGENRKILLEYVTDASMYGFDAGDTLKLSVTAFDQENREGPASSAVTVVMGGAANNVNVIALSEPMSPVSAVIGTVSTLPIRLSASNTRHTNSAYVLARTQTRPYHPPMSDRYAAQMSLPEIGRAGQARLSASRVLVVGCGGTGSSVIHYLAAAGVGAIGIADPDTVELSNLNRQILHTVDDIGRPKVSSAKEKLARLNPETTVHAYERRFGADLVREIPGGYQIVIDATDDWESKISINGACVGGKKPLIYTGVMGWEGCLFFIMPGVTACLRCAFPDPPLEQAGPSVIGAAAGAIGCLAAAQALRFLLDPASAVESTVHYFNFFSGVHRRLDVRKAAGCTVCGKT